MKTSAGLLLAALAVGPLLAAAQDAGGRIEGRLVNETDPKVVPKGVELDVIGLGGGMTVLKSAVTDAQGRFRIEGVPTSGPLMIRVSYQSVNYHGRVSFEGSKTATVEIAVYETTPSWKGVRVEEARLGFQLEGEHLRVLERYTFVNETEPRRTLMSPEGTFRFAKPEGIEAVPEMTVTGPGGAMPLRQPPLESADGASYYSLYGLRPGRTSFEIQYTLPYHDRSYAYRKRFFHEIPSFQLGVSPQDLDVAGQGLAKVHSEEERNFAVYSGGPVKAGTEAIWTFSGGTGGEETRSSGSKVQPMPNDVGRNALLIAPLLLMAWVAVLWYGYNRLAASPKAQEGRQRELRDRRDVLLNHLATLDHRHESQALDRKEYVRQREEAKRQLRRVHMLLGKK